MKTSRLALAALAVFGASNTVFAATCDRACLLDQAKQFNAAMLAHTPEKIQLAPDAQTRENTKAITLADSKWSIVKEILSEGVYNFSFKPRIRFHDGRQPVDRGRTVGQVAACC